MGPSEDPVPVRDRVTVLTSVVLLLIAAAAWVSVIRASLRGDDMMMTMPMPVTAADGLAFVVRLGRHDDRDDAAERAPDDLAVRRRSAGRRRSARPGLPVAGFTAVYVLLWAASGVPVYLAHTFLMTLPGSAFAYGVAAILLAAGAFQLSPLKQVCLRACRSPLGFLLGHWRAGRRGSLALGWSHALYCLGCCWALMLVLVAAGAMGLRWVLLITAVVAAEKLLPGGEWFARAAGGALLLLGVTVALRPDLVTVLRGGHAM